MWSTQTHARLQLWLPEIVFKLSCAAIWSGCAVHLESVQTPDSRIGCEFTSSALYSIQFRKWGNVPVPLFTQRPMNGRRIERSDKRYFGRSQVLVKSIESSFQMKKKIWIFFSNRELEHLLLFSELFACACSSDPPKLSCAWALTQELDHWFCSQNFRLSSGIAFGSDCQMTWRGSILDSNLNFASWPMSCKDFICSESLKKLCRSLNSF